MIPHPSRSADERPEVELPPPKRVKHSHGESNDNDIHSFDERRTEGRWLADSRKVIPLSSGHCTPMRKAYGQELQPIRIGCMTFHQYPNRHLEKKWQQKARDRPYHAFLEDLILQGKWDIKNNNVLYFNDKELKGLQAHFDQGNIVRGWNGTKGKPFKPKRYIFVLSQSNELFLVQKFVTPVGRIQHSSLSGGQPVQCAGWLTFDEQGALKEISNFTGHYWITRDAINSLLQFLECNGVDLSNVEIVFSEDGKAKNFNRYTLEEWLM